MLPVTLERERVTQWIIWSGRMISQWKLIRVMQHLFSFVICCFASSRIRVSEVCVALIEFLRTFVSQCLNVYSTYHHTLITGGSRSLELILRKTVMVMCTVPKALLKTEIIETSSARAVNSPTCDELSSNRNMSSHSVSLHTWKLFSDSCSSWHQNSVFLARNPQVDRVKTLQY